MVGWSVGRLVCNAFVRQSTRRTLLTYLALFLKDAKAAVVCSPQHDHNLPATKAHYICIATDVRHVSSPQSVHDFVDGRVPSLCCMSQAIDLSPRTTR